MFTVRSSYIHKNTFPYNQFLHIVNIADRNITTAIFKVSCYGHFNTLPRNPTIVTGSLTRYLEIPVVTGILTLPRTPSCYGHFNTLPRNFTIVTAF